jgi:hypothetical protein
MNTGVLGLNIIGDAGISYDNAAAWQRDIGGRFAVAINGGGKLSAQLQSAGVVVLHRIKAPSSNDDSVLQYAPREFVELRHRDAPAGAVLYIANENRPSTALDRWLVSAIEVAEEMGRKVCLGNWTTHTQYIDLLLVRRAIRRAVEGGHYCGAHVYFPHAGISTSLSHDMNGWLKLAQDVGGQWVITELAFAAADAFGNIDPHAGHIGRIGEAEYADLLEAAARFYASYGVYATVYSYGRWHDFEIHDSAMLKYELTNINRSVLVAPSVEHSVPLDSAPGWKDVELNSTGTATYVRAQPVTSAASVGRITQRTAARLNEPAGVQQKDGRWLPVIIKATSARGWVRSDVVVEAPPIDPPVVTLNVPYASQLGRDAERINNDCPEASALMLIQYERARAGKRIMRGLTVDMLVTRGETRPRLDTVKDLDFIVTLLEDFGVEAQRVTGLTPARIVEFIDRSRPPIVLVNYEHLKPGKRFGHFALVEGYGERGFYLHDPYLLGRSAYITLEQLDKALTDVEGIANRPYQGVVLL